MRRSTWREWRKMMLWGGTLGLIGSVGCGSDATGPAPVDAAQLYLQLTLNHHAITMALAPPYNTLQLVATPRSATGASLADTGTTTYSVSFDRDRCACQSISVSPTGLITADSVDSRVFVIASHTIGNVTKVDTAVVAVNDVNPVPVFTVLKLQPLQLGDSAFSGGLGFNNLQYAAQALDENHGEIPGVLFSVQSRNSSIVDAHMFAMYQGDFRLFLNFLRPGRTYIVVSATIYGRSLVDSLLYTVGWQLFREVGINPGTPAGHTTPLGYFSPHDDTIAVGGHVNWVNQMSGQSVDVVFDNPAAIQAIDSTGSDTGEIPSPDHSGGNIAPFAPMDSTNGLDGIGIRVRRFPTAGTYPYHSALYGTAGVIHVLPLYQFAPSLSH